MFCSFLNKLCYYITIFYLFCQEKNYDKILQITTDVSIPIMSATSAAIITHLVFFIPTELVYIAIVYSVVSVEPIITDAIKPILLSTPCCVIISVATAIDALPDIGLNNASGIICAGIFIVFNIGSIICTINSIIPELLNTPTAKNIPNNVGNKFITISIPSFAPFKNVSNVLFFSATPYIIIINIISGIAIDDM